MMAARIMTCSQVLLEEEAEAHGREGWCCVYNGGSQDATSSSSTKLFSPINPQLRTRNHSAFGLQFITMKFNIALLAGLISLASAAPAPVAEEKRQPSGSTTPNFTHIWTDTPGVGFFTASSVGRVLFPLSPNTHPISTHQTFTSTSLQNTNVKVGFNKGSANIAEGTKFRVHLSLADLDLNAGQNKAGNNARDSQVATFEIQRGTGAVVLVEGGTFLYPNRAKVTLEVVGDNKNPPNADFSFNTAAGEGLYLTNV